jgi:hypothetical protein
VYFGPPSSTSLIRGEGSSLQTPGAGNEQRKRLIDVAKPVSEKASPAWVWVWNGVPFGGEWRATNPLSRDVNRFERASTTADSKLSRSKFERADLPSSFFRQALPLLWSRHRWSLMHSATPGAGAAPLSMLLPLLNERPECTRLRAKLETLPAVTLEMSRTTRMYGDGGFWRRIHSLESCPQVYARLRPGATGVVRVGSKVGCAASPAALTSAYSLTESP